MERIMEMVINRARAMLAFASEAEVAGRLMESGVDAGTAFLAVKAAVILEAE